MQHMISISMSSYSVVKQKEVFVSGDYIVNFIRRLLSVTVDVVTSGRQPSIHDLCFKLNDF